MPRPEKGVKLGLFLANEIINNRGGVLDRTYADIANYIKSPQLVRQITKDFLCENDRYNYAEPIKKNKGKAMSYLRDDDENLPFEDDGLPLLVDYQLDINHNSTPVIKQYWLNLVEFEDVVRLTSITPEQTAMVLQKRVHKERDSWKQKASARYERYVREREHIWVKKQKREGDRAKSANVNATNLLTGLQTQQQYAAAFHTFTVAFCAAHNQSPPPPLVLSPLLAIFVIAVDDSNDFGN